MITQNMSESAKVVTHQWSGDPSIEEEQAELEELAVVTHQWSGDPSMSGSFLSMDVVQS